MTTTITYYSTITKCDRTVKAVRRGNLAINAAEYQYFHGDITHEGWNVTHVPTGAIIVHTRSIWAARRALRALAALGDWDFTLPVSDEQLDISGLDPKFIRKAVQIVKRFRER